MRSGTEIELSIGAITPDGDGWAESGGRQFHVARAVPGDRVVARVFGRRRGVTLAQVIARQEETVARRAPLCPAFGVCGGCRWQEVRYADQLSLKASMVATALQSADVPLPDPEPILPSPDEFFYRNKMEFAFGRSREGEFQLGLHARGSFNRLINTERCMLQSTTSIAIVNAVRRAAPELELPVYDLRRHVGVLRFLTVRDAKSSGEHLVNLVVGAYPHAGVDSLAERVLAQVQAITTWVTALHEGKAQVAMGQGVALAHGTGAIVERCNGIDYQISPKSFLQTNTRQTEQLYRLVCDWAGDVRGARILDLYCGAGGVGLQLARGAGQVCGIESVPEAVADARGNAHRNGIGNCIFLEGAVETVLPGLAHEAFPLAIVDPPRAGMHERAAAALAALRPPRILYVSCNATTLAVDVGRLALAGYRVRRWRPVDLFPQTPHCEVVAELALEGA